MVNILIFIGVALIILKLAGLIFWLWWVVLLPLAIVGVFFAALFFWIRKQGNPKKFWS